jgi:putative transcriptional regulator
MSLDIMSSCLYSPGVRNRLRLLRTERGWSQSSLADRLEVSRQTVIAIETGRYDPSLPLAFRIARLFGRSIEGVFEPEVEFAQGDGAR